MILSNDSGDLTYFGGRGCINISYCNNSDPDDIFGVTPRDEAEVEKLENVVKIVVPIFFGLTIIVGLVGNLLVVVVVAANQQMRSTTNLLIINLAIADLLFIIFCVPFTATDYIFTWWPFGDTWCKIVQYMIVVTAYASVYTLVFMSFDRYLAVVHPITSISVRTERNAIIGIVITWLVILILSIPVLMSHGEQTYTYNSDIHTVCIFLQQEGAYNKMVFHVSFFATSYVIPLALICGLYLRMLIRLWRGVAPGGHVSAEGRRGRKRVTRMVVVVVAIFAFCWCPIQVILVLKSMNLYEITHTTVVVQIASQVLAYMNSCVNPILYAFLSDNFRKAFRKFRRPSNVSNFSTRPTDDTASHEIRGGASSSLNRNVKYTVIYCAPAIDRNNVLNRMSVQQHNGQEKHTVTTKTSKGNGDIL